MAKSPGHPLGSFPQGKRPGRKRLSGLVHTPIRQICVTYHPRPEFTQLVLQDRPAV